MCVCRSVRKRNTLKKQEDCDPEEAQSLTLIANFHQHIGHDVTAARWAHSTRLKSVELSLQKHDIHLHFQLKSDPADKPTRLHVWSTSQMLLSLVEADQHLQIYDCFMVQTMSVINFIVVYEENTAPIKKGNVFLTLLMMSIYGQSIVQIQETVGVRLLVFCYSHCSHFVTTQFLLSSKICINK